MVGTVQQKLNGQARQIHNQGWWSVVGKGKMDKNKNHSAQKWWSAEYATEELICATLDI